MYKLAALVVVIAALAAGKVVATANKETLVMAGELMTRAAAASGVGGNGPLKLVNLRSTSATTAS